MKRREFLAGTLALPALAQPKTHAFSWREEQFLLDGQPFLIRSGEMHYPRVPRPYWRDRMRKMRAMGLNTLCTYVFWNLHEPREDKFDFSDNLDIAEYVRTAQAEGLYVLLRPGPYICTEWDFGGLPWWLLSTDMKVRGADPRFLRAAALYMNRVGKELAGLQIHRGGPILMVQVENEYGSFGSDHEYMGAVRHMIQDAGFDCQLYTSDGSGKSNLAGGTLDGVLSVINFGDGSSPEREFANFAAFRQNVPRMCGEFWYGWFDHWGEQHHTTSAQRGAAGVDWMLSRGISCNLYMAHGGSTFGYMAGANGGRVYEPDVSAYDYDAPIDEAGRPNAKFNAMRDVLRKYLSPGEQLPDPPPALPVITIPRFEMSESAPLAGRLPKPAQVGPPVSMEQLGQDYGFVLYRHHPARAAKGTLEIGEVRDFAVVRGATLDRRLKQNKVEVELKPGEPLDILVEAMGRINFGPLLVSDRKGIAGRVTLNGEELKDWEHYSLPMADPGRWPFDRKTAATPALYRGTFRLESVGDTFFDMRAWGKGLVWINGHNLGRYWRVGPQQTLFVPAPWLKSGVNEAIVLDLLPGGTRSLGS
jgi:beta-galactosidase